MEAKLFTFTITDFEEVYVVIDRKNNRLHLSSVNYSYNINLNLTTDLVSQINTLTEYGEQNFNSRVRQVCSKIIEELGLY